MALPARSRRSRWSLHAYELKLHACEWQRDIAKKAAAYFAQDVLRGMPGLSK